MAFSTLNGHLPASMLVALPWPEASGQRLRPDAAASLGRLAAVFAKDFGRPLLITDSYRSYDAQVRTKAAKGIYAATPGTSNHGLGIAVDLSSGINSAASTTHRWMEVNGPAFGWTNPLWARDANPFNGQFEPWHWEYEPLNDRSSFAQASTAAPTPTPLAPEDDMFSDDDRNALAAVTAQVKEIRGALGAGGGDQIRVEDTIGYRVRDVQMALTNTLPVLLGAASRQGIDPAQITAAVVAAIPTDIAQDVLDGLAARLRA